MKKIFIGNHALYLADEKRARRLRQQYAAEHRLLRVQSYSSAAALHQLIERLDASSGSADWLIVHESLDRLEKIYFSLYKSLVAAGGLVTDGEGKLLMMFRRGLWDLPKGKMDAGETIRQAAKREVKEETGIKKLRVGKKIRFLNGEQDCTYHTYLQKGKHIIKSTYWFEMEGDSSEPLTPQTEEGITEVGWYSKSRVRLNLKNSYRSIAAVLDDYLAR